MTISLATLTPVNGELVAVIGAFIDGWNDHPHPFVWTKDTDKILASINHTKIKTSVLTDH